MLFPDKINILHIVHNYTIGGAEVVLANLCKHSSPEINNLICSLTSPDEAFIKKHKEQQVISLNKKPGNDFAVINRIKVIIREHKIHIVHAQGWATYLEGLIPTKILSKKRPKFIFAFHGKTIEDVLSGIPLRRRLAQRIASYFSDKIIAPSIDMATDYMRTFGVAKNNIQVIYNGIEIDRFSTKVDNAKEKIGIHADNFIVGFVGRLDRVKNLEGLIQVFSIFLEQLTSSQQSRSVLLLIGDGEERLKIEKLSTELGLSQNIIFTGRSDKIPLYLSAMDVYIQPSFYEGHSNTIIEAMAASLPVISTDVGGTHEIIDHETTGFLYQPDDYQGMADILSELYNSSSLRQKIGERGRKTVSSNFSVEKMVAGYEQLYKELLL